MPAGKEVVVMFSGTATVRLRGALAAAAMVSVTWTVKLVVPVPVGVPEITPVPGAIASPPGSAPAEMDHV